MLTAAFNEEQIAVVFEIQQQWELKGPKNGVQQDNTDFLSNKM